MPSSVLKSITQRSDAMRLTDRPKDVLEYDGIGLRLNLAFDTVLRSFELIRDEDFTEREKLEIHLEMLIENYQDAATLPLKDKVQIRDHIFLNFINDPDSKTGKEGKKTFDIDQDAEYVYASFLFDYGIDLFEQQGKLHWKKFKALLGGLSKEAKLSQVIGYRNCKIPKATKHNKEYVQYLKEMKRVYALDKTPETVEELDRRMDMVADKIKGSPGK